MKFIFTKDYTLGEALNYVRNKVVYKNYGLKLRFYDDYTVILALEMPDNERSLDLEFQAWKSLYSAKLLGK